MLAMWQIWGKYFFVSYFYLKFTSNPCYKCSAPTSKEKAKTILPLSCINQNKDITNFQKIKNAHTILLDHPQS